MSRTLTLELVARDRPAVADRVAVAQLARHIRLLVDPFTIAVFQTQAGKTRWVAIDHEPLLDQLRNAASTPGGATLTETLRQRSKESSPPVAGTGLKALSAVYVGISAWHARLNLPSPDRALDWQKAALRQLSRAADRRTTIRAAAVWLGLADARIIVDGHRTPTAAAMALAERLLSGEGLGRLTYEITGWGPCDVEVRWCEAVRVRSDDAELTSPPAPTVHRSDPA